MTQNFAINCLGGLDQESGNLEVHPGRVRESLNYEAMPEGGYRRIDGYALWSGGSLFPDLTAATTQIVLVNQIANEVRNRDLTETVVTATGKRFKIAGYVPVFDGSSAANPFPGGTQASGYHLLIELSRPADQLVAGDLIVVGGSVTEVVDAQPALNDAEYELLIDTVFAQTNVATKPEGDGPIKGIIETDDGTIHVFRLNSAIGANGGFTVSRPSADGTVFGSGWLLLASVPFENSVTPDMLERRWSLTAHEFAGSTEEFYVSFGFGRPYRWDGNFATSGYIPPAPTSPTAAGIASSHVIEFQEHLFHAFGSNLIYSDLSDPTTISGGNGGEIRIGHEITGMQVIPGNTLAIFTEESIYLLYGTSSADFRLVQHTEEIGAIAGSLQDMPTAIFCDRRGVMTLNQSDRHGDYISNTLSHHFDRLYRQIIAEPIWSQVNRSKSQYRVFNEYGRGFWMTFNDRTLAGAMEIDLKLPSRITAVGERHNRAQHDELFIGTEDGCVFRTDYGPTFNGERIPAYLKFPYCHCQSPQRRKRFRAAFLDIEGDARTSLQARGEVGYGFDTHQDNRIVDTWFESSTQLFQGEFSYDMPPVMEGRVYLEGSAENLAMVFRSNSKSNYSHLLHSIELHYDYRGMRR